MYDSVTAADIPLDCDLVAGYIDGTWKWSEEDWGRFPGKPQVRIAVDPNTNDGNCGDVEWSDMTPETAVYWVRRRREAGVDPSLYVAIYNYEAVIAAFEAAGEPLPYLWIAHYDDVPEIPEGFVAKQYANATYTGGHYDASVVVDFWPGVDMGVSQEEFNTYKADVKATVEAMKAAYDPLVSHIHVQTSTGITTGPFPKFPPEPPVAGYVYAGASSDMSIIIWFSVEDGKNHFYQNGKEMASV